MERLNQIPPPHASPLLNKVSEKGYFFAWIHQNEIKHKKACKMCQNIKVYKLLVLTK